MEEGADGLFFVEPLTGGECECVDTTELTVWRIADEPFEGIDDVRWCRLAQHGE